MSDSPDPANNKVDRPWLVMLFSLAAIGLAVLHIVRPELGIDSTAIVLLVVAVLPWALPFLSKTLKSFRYGDLEVQFQEHKEAVEQRLEEEEKRIQEHREELEGALQEEKSQRQQLGERVEQLEIVFKGEPAPLALQEELTAALKKFDRYLRGLGVTFGEFPAVLITRNLPDPRWLAHYKPETNELVVSPRAVHEADVVCREYCYRAFHEPLADKELAGDIANNVLYGRSHGIALLLSALGYYLPCSFKDASRFSDYFDLSHGFLFPRRPLPDREADDFRRAELISVTSLFWAGLFWEMRELVGRELADKTLVETFYATLGVEAAEAEVVQAEFSRKLLALLEPKIGQESARSIREALAKREIDLS